MINNTFLIVFLGVNIIECKFSSRYKVRTLHTTKFTYIKMCIYIYIYIYIYTYRIYVYKLYVCHRLFYFLLIGIYSHGLNISMSDVQIFIYQLLL